MLRQPQALLQPPRLDAMVNDSRTQVVDFNAVPHPISLALIRLQTVTSRPEQVGYEVHVRGEATIAASLVKSLRKCSPGEDIFVATPHRIQRQAVKAALDSEEDSLVHAMQGMNIAANAGNVVVDTVERLQGEKTDFRHLGRTYLLCPLGSEAAFVICLFSLPHNSASQSELSFLLERRRLNVAISRAKTLCILVTSDNVLRPSVKVLSDEGSAKGYAFLRAFEERAWSASITIDLDGV
jgi:superfamily I DNA and/or RNA helicase